MTRFQLRTNGNGSTSVVDVRTGQVRYTGSLAVARDTAASLNARRQRLEARIIMTRPGAVTAAPSRIMRNQGVQK